MHESEDDIIEDIRPQTILEAKGILPYICDDFNLDAESRFNTLTIRLDGRLQSDLNWNLAKKQAEQAINAGFALFWEIDLGLFEGLTLSISNQTQFLSLGLSLDHFKNTLWKEYASHSLGLSIFRGEADFSLKFKWDDDQLHSFHVWLKKQFFNEQELAEIIGPLPLENMRLDKLQATPKGKTLQALFCRDVCVEYLALLAARLPDSLPCYLFLDATSIQDSVLKQLQLLNPDRYDFLHLALKGVTLPFKAWGWQSPVLQEGYVGTATNCSDSKLVKAGVKIGVCLPLMDNCHPDHWQDLEPAIEHLSRLGIPFKLISESQLITEWDGLDALLFNPKGLSSQGKRKLQGFCAAGGLTVTANQLIGLACEMSFSEWIDSLNCSTPI